MKLKAILLFAILSGSLAQAQTENSSLTYHVELGATAGNGTYAPLWFTGISVGRNLLRETIQTRMAY